jgi:hypothetical protein
MHAYDNREIVNAHLLSAAQRPSSIPCEDRAYYVRRPAAGNLRKYRVVFEHMAWYTLVDVKSIGVVTSR